MKKAFVSLATTKACNRILVLWVASIIISFCITLIFSVGVHADSSSVTLRNNTKFISLESVRMQQGGKKIRMASAGVFKPLNRKMLQPIRSHHYKKKKRDDIKEYKKVSAPAQLPKKEGRVVNSDAIILDLFGANRSELLTDIRHQWPLDTTKKQRVSSLFGERDDPFTGKDAFHAGVDIAAAIGTHVYASAAGIVEGVGVHPRLGRYIKIVHRDGSTSQYGHLHRMFVQEGQIVESGHYIGEVGNTGRSTGPHLDYSLRVNGQPIDPLAVLSMPEAVHALTQTLEISSVQ